MSNEIKAPAPTPVAAAKSWQEILISFLPLIEQVLTSILENGKKQTAALEKSAAEHAKINSAIQKHVELQHKLHGLKV